MNDRNADRSDPPTDEDPPRVLVVDDETGLCDLYAAWLADDYDVQTANDGSGALAAVDEDTDVVLLDRQLPDRPGRDVIERIRERGLPCRVAMVTAVDPDFDIVDIGFDDYLTKPVTADDLHHVVSELLDRREYDEDLRDLYALETKRRLLEVEKSEPELDASDEYARLVDDVHRLRRSLDDRLETFDDEDFRAAFLTLGTGGRSAG